MVMHYQVSQGLRGGYLPDYQTCVATLDEATAYMASEIEAIVDVWPTRKVNPFMAVYGDHSQFAIVIAECDCEDTADFNDRDHGGGQEGYWELQTYHNGNFESSEKLDSADNLGLDVRQFLSDIASDLDLDAMNPATIVISHDLDAMATYRTAQRAWVGTVTYPTEDDGVSHVDVYATWWPSED